ncbi:MAG: hypothetical protein IPK58_26020 [Acidobacteria bacterium]|nr:hypothetical protein [Acidobacteriota bacterium]
MNPESAEPLPLLSFFNEEQAEIRLAVDEEYGEYGIGREHLRMSAPVGNNRTEHRRRI